jgi:predicted enzyme related to lactoylglutathione lyase
MHEICHIEIPSTDHGKSKAFYEKVFGWKVDLMPEMDYAVWEAPEGPGGGFTLVKEPCDCGEGCCLVYVNVANIDDKVKEIEAAGGEILTARSPVGDMGWYAMFRDAAGGVAALWESAKKA